MLIPKFKPLENTSEGTKKKVKPILMVIIALLLGAFGLEVSNNDWDLGKILSGSSPSESKLLRDEKGNLLKDEAGNFITRIMRDKEGNVVTSGGKYTDEYNCDDFSTQPEAQKFFDKAGGTRKDTNRLDGDKDGIACEDLPGNPNTKKTSATDLCTKNSYACKDFKYQEDAQEVFDTCDKESVTGLDANKDGLACESLPKKE